MLVPFEVAPFEPWCEAGHSFPVSSESFPSYRTAPSFPLLLKDLDWFIQFTSSFNKVVYSPSRLDHRVWLNFGGAEAVLLSFYSLQHPQAKLTLFTHLEVFNLVLALSYLLPPSPHNFTIVVNMDNQTLQQVLSWGNDQFLCAYARQLWLIATSVRCSLANQPDFEL